MNNKSDIVILTREQLYNLVWEQPMSEILRIYYTYGSEIKKHCSEMDIPMPKPGYWKMHENGAPPPKKALSATNSRTKFIKLRLRTTRKIEDSTPLEVMSKAIEQALGDTLNVAKQITDLHELVGKTKRHLESLKKSKGLWRSDIHHLDINTSPENLMVCIGFYNCLVKGLEQRGHSIEIRTQIGNRGTFAIVEGESVRLIVTEKTSKEQHYRNGTFYFGDSSPLGTIKVRIGNVDFLISPYELDLELPMFLARIEIEAFAMKARRGDPATICKIQTDHSKYIQCEHELADFKLLIEKAERWKTANTMREYLKHIVRGAHDKIDVSSELSHWISWANKKIEWYDPSIEREDVIFEMVDRSKLEIKTIDGRFIKD